MSFLGGLTNGTNWIPQRSKRSVERLDAIAREKDPAACGGVRDERKVRR